MPHSRPGTSMSDGQRFSEQRLLERIRRGDRAAFSAIYRLYHPRLYGYLRRLLSDPVSIDEVLDDVMLVVWKDAHKFRGAAPVSSWVFGIAYRKALTALRAERRHQAPLDHAVDVGSVAAPPRKYHEWIQSALMRLSPDHRQVVELTYFCGFSYREIAEIAGCPVNTVKTRMYHARRRLRRLLPLLMEPTKERGRERA